MRKFRVPDGVTAMLARGFVPLGGNLLFVLAIYSLDALAEPIGPRYALPTTEILAI